MIEAVYNAAPASIQSSLRNGAWADSLTSEAWFTAVPSAAQSALSSQQAALDSAQYAILGTPTTGSKNAAPKATQAVGVMAAAAAGAVGLVGAMVAL